MSASVPSPWTQNLRLRWEPELQFYEQRTALLRQLQEEGVLRAFRMHESQVDAQLFDSRHEMTVRHDGLTLDVAGGEDISQALGVVQHAFDLIRPSSTVRIHTGSQFIVEVDHTFEDALDVAHRAFLRNTDFSGIATPDFALLVDLQMEGPPAARGAVEFGLVRDREIPERVGVRSRRRPGSRDTGFDFTNVRLPDVAIFADAGLRFDPLESNEAREGLLTFLQQTDDMLGTVVIEIERSFNEADATDDRGGG